MNRLIPTTLAACVVLAATAPAQTRAEAPAVRDGAKIFSAAAVEAAERGLREVQSGSEGRWQVLIETVDSLGGKAPRDLAVANAEKARLKGLSVVIAKAEKKVFVEPSASAEAAFPKAERERIVTAFTKAFKQGDFDRGLRDAVAEVRFAALKVGVRDAAGMFSPDAVAKADDALDAVRRKTRWATAIETVNSLEGRSPREAADANARALKVHGLYVLIAKADKKFFAEPSVSAEKVFTRDRIKSLEDGLASAFKAGDFDKGLLTAVDTVRQTAESAAGAKADLAPVFPEPARALPEARKPVPAAPEPAPPHARPVAMEHPKPGGAERGSILPIALIGGVILLGLWIISKAFRRPQPQGQMPSQAYSTGYPQGTPGPTPPGPRPGPGQQPPPGYGYGQPNAPGYGPPPAPGYGYGPPPQQGGGGLLSGALGGLGGAIAGNILYDQFGRRHEGQAPAHVPGGVVPPAGSNWPDAGAGAGAGAGVGGPPPETYDPNAGAEGSWGGPEPEDAGTGGSWGAPEGPEPDAATGGSWGDADQAATGGDWGSDASPEPEPDTGGDWGSEPEPDTGGDWGGDTDDDQGQGGGW